MKLSDVESITPGELLTVNWNPEPVPPKSAWVAERMSPFLYPTPSSKFGVWEVARRF